MASLDGSNQDMKLVVVERTYLNGDLCEGHLRQNFVVFQTELLLSHTQSIVRILLGPFTLSGSASNVENILVRTVSHCAYVANEQSKVPYIPDIHYLSM